LRVGVARPQAVRTTKVGNARSRGDARTGQYRHPTGRCNQHLHPRHGVGVVAHHVRKIVCHFRRLMHTPRRELAPTQPHGRALARPHRGIRRILGTFGICGMVLAPGSRAFRYMAVATHRLRIRRLPQRLRPRYPRHRIVDWRRCTRRHRHDLRPRGIPLADVRGCTNGAYRACGTTCPATRSTPPPTTNAGAPSLGTS